MADLKDTLLVKLIDELAEAKAAKMLAQQALDKANEALAEVKAMKNSTHQVFTYNPERGFVPGDGDDASDPIAPTEAALQKQLEDAEDIFKPDILNFDFTQTAPGVRNVD